MPLTSEDGTISVTISTVLLWVEAFVLAGIVHYVTRRLLGVQFRLSMLLSLLTVGIWALLSLAAFLYVTPVSLAGLAVPGNWRWAGYALLLFVLFALAGRYLVLVPWAVAVGSAVIVVATWFVGLCFAAALEAGK